MPVPVAHAEAMYEWTREYIKDRAAFGKTLADLQTMRHKMADMKTEIAVARSFADQCIVLLDVSCLHACILTLMTPRVLCRRAS